MHIALFIVITLPEPTFDTTTLKRFTTDTHELHAWVMRGADVDLVLHQGKGFSLGGALPEGDFSCVYALGKYGKALRELPGKVIGGEVTAMSIYEIGAQRQRPYVLADMNIKDGAYKAALIVGDNHALICLHSSLAYKKAFRTLVRAIAESYVAKGGDPAILRHQAYIMKANNDPRGLFLIDNERTTGIIFEKNGFSQELSSKGGLKDIDCDGGKLTVTGRDKAVCTRPGQAVITLDRLID